MSSADVCCVVGGDWAVLHMLLAGCVVWVLPMWSFVGSVIDVIVGEVVDAGGNPSDSVVVDADVVLVPAVVAAGTVGCGVGADVGSGVVKGGSCEVGFGGGKGVNCSVEAGVGDGVDSDVVLGVVCGV